MLKTFIISDELFQGYSIIVDVMLFDSIKSLTTYVKEKLKALFVKNNLEILCKKVDKLNLHIHECKFISELQTQDNFIIYLCSHC